MIEPALGGQGDRGDAGLRLQRFDDGFVLGRAEDRFGGQAQDELHVDVVVGHGDKRQALPSGGDDPEKRVFRAEKMIDPHEAVAGAQGDDDAGDLGLKGKHVLDRGGERHRPSDIVDQLPGALVRPGRPGACAKSEGKEQDGGARGDFSHGQGDYYNRVRVQSRPASLPAVPLCYHGGRSSCPDTRPSFS